MVPAWMYHEGEIPTAGNFIEFVRFGCDRGIVSDGQHVDSVGSSSRSTHVVFFFVRSMCLIAV